MKQAILSAIILIVYSPLSRAEKAPRPNIILINADNLGYGDFGCYGNKIHRTPVIDNLAREGVRFTDFYAASPVCTSSRAALLTGCYPRRNGMHEFKWDGSVLRPVSPHGLHPDEITLAELLRGKGYFTACLGKWHLGDQDRFLPWNHGFDYFLGLLYSDEMDNRYTAYNWPPMPLMENREVIEAPAVLDTMTKRYTERALQIIRDHRDRPFFLYLAHMSPGSRREPIAGTPFQGKSRNGKYGDTIEELDWSTGEILKALEETGQSKNTLLIWTADNGAPPPRGMENHGSFGSLAPRVRYDAAEGGLRVPMLARWPGKIPAGTECREIATNMDLFTTLATWGGAEIPEDRTIDGKNISSLFTDPLNSESPHEAFFYYFGGQLQAVRSGKWKLNLPMEKPLLQLGMGELGYSVTKRYNRLFGDPVPARLYNLDEDIGEKRDVSGEHPGVVEELLNYADTARKEIGDLDQTPDSARPPGTVENPVPQLAK